MATAEQYYDQANQLAATGQTPQNEEWLPLGVFSVMSDNGQTSMDKIAQLALNKDAAVSGTLYDKLTGRTAALSGAVDKTNQRVAVRPEGNETVLFEMGLNNLTEDKVPVLIHLDKTRVEQRLLVRLAKPEEEAPKPAE